jgi:hypothetical protein
MACPAMRITEIIEKGFSEKKDKWAVFVVYCKKCGENNHDIN